MTFITGRHRLAALLALLAGASLPLGFAPFGWFVLPLLAMTIWMLLLQGVTPKHAVWIGWLFGFGLFAAGTYWVYVSIYLYGNASLTLAVLVTILFVAFLALFPALAAWLSARLQRRSYVVNFLLLFPAVWTLIEWLRGWLFTGFPWLDLGYSQIDSPLAAAAPLLGVYGVSWLLAFCAGLLATVVSARRVGRLLAGVALVVLILALWVIQDVEWTELAGEPLMVTLVQGNISQELKWRPQEQQPTMQRYVELTAEHTDSQIVVWPETAIPAYYDQVEESFIEPLRKGLAKKGVALVTGIPVLDRTEWQYYNAVISLDDPGHFYYKVHLVPFGEYLPLRNWLSRVLDFLPIPQADFSAGRPDQPLLKAAGYPFAASICYEIAFGEQLIKALPEAAFLINVSNDAWFGDSLAPHQHLEMARMRARETGRWLLRATNTGISAIIDPDGMVVAQARQFEVDTVSHDIEPRRGATPYARLGNTAIIGFCLLLLVASLWLVPPVAKRLPER